MIQEHVSAEIRKSLLLSIWSIFLEPKRRKKAVHGFLLVLILSHFSACMTVHHDNSQVPAGSQIVFIVANSDTNLPMRGVNLILISRKEPARELVTTNENGRASVSKAVLATPGVAVLLFCAEDFFCGALRPREDALLDFDERLIQLAPFAIY